MSSTSTIEQPAISAPVTTWTIDPAHSQVGFAVRHLMISTVRGRFSEVSGTVAVPGGDFSRARIDATIGVASIDTREAQRDAHLRSADFFDADKYPIIRFVSRKVEAASADQSRFAVTGDLSLHGVTREIRLDVTIEGRGMDPWGNERVGFSAIGKLNRKDFGLMWNQLLETGGVAVGEEVKLSIDAELVANAANAAA